MRLPTRKIHTVLTLFLAFSLPLDRRISPILIALLFLNWLIDWNWKEKIANYKIHKAALLPCLLYLLYSVGMLYTKNLAFGMKDLETKLSLLLLPLIYSSQPSLKREEINKLFHYFTLGCGLAIIICLGHSAFLYYNEIQQVKNGTLHDTYTNVNFFFSSQLSYFMHPSYFAMYLCLAIVYLCSVILNSGNSYSKKSKYIFASLSIAYSIFIAFLASRMGIILLAIIWSGILSYILLKKKYYIQGSITLAILIISFFLLYKNSQIIASRVDLTLNTLTSKKLDKTSSESSTARMLIWKQAISFIKENPILGVGTGDIKDALMEKYKAEGMTGAFDHKLNAHNQFFQTSIAVGMPGLLLLIAILFVPMLIRKYQYILFIFFCICIILNFSVESMLEIQAGTIFFAFFNSLLLLHPKDSSQ